MQSPGPRQLNDKSSRDGQAAILLAIMVSSFLMFFMFAVNTGLLINAKISVQTAADAAAYAGAAAQARQLNAISYLNYDMRRQFKKFVFRYAFVSSMGNAQFPGAGADTADYDFKKLDYSAGSTATVLPLKVPVVCLPISAATEMSSDSCLAVNYRNTAYDVQNAVGGVLASLNSITQAYLNSVTSISGIANDICSGRSGVNVFAALAWLFRGDLDDSSIDQMLQSVTASTLTNTERAKIKDQIKNLIQGLGLFPRNVINLMRIETLKDFINEKPANIDWDGMKALENAQGTDAHERTILAYRSALGNLNSSVFDAEKTRLEELQPAKMLELEEVKASFKVFVQAMIPKPAGSSISSSNPTACDSFIYKINANDAPVGVKLSSGGGKNVFYAVRLRTFVKPRGLLFMQGSGELELDAMAAAKPFGSRIGPKNLSAADFVVTKSDLPAVNNTVFCSSDCKSPNLSLGNGISFFSMKFIRDMHTLAGGTSPSISAILDAQRHALAPNPTEVGLFNIIPPAPSADGGSNPMDFEFIPFSDPKSVTGKPQVYRFYAPVFPQGGASVAQKVDQFLQSIFPSVSVSTDPIGLDLSSLRDKLKTSLTNYIGGSALSSGGSASEHGETETFAALELPIQPPLQSKPYLSITSKEVRTSWSPDHHKVSAYDVRFTPRFGYSVKLVSFRDLMRQGLSADDEDVEKMSH
jgi:hypothetical protein